MIGFVHFDRTGITNERTEILVSVDKLPALIRNKYVKIVNPSSSPNNDKVFLGRIVEGPFFHPEEVARDSALAQTAILKGETFPNIPSYYAVGGIEILGELQNGIIIGVNTRPAPQAEVHELSSKDMKDLLFLEGDMLLGSLDGYSDVSVYLESSDKKIVPRNIGIFGTVGSGKTNSAQVLIEELSRNGWAVIVLDVEGEYINMDKPTKELKEQLKPFSREPKGLEQFEVYYPASSGTDREPATQFTLLTGEIEPLVLSELIEPSEAQERRLLNIIEELVREGKDDEDEKDKATTLRDTLEKRKHVGYTLSDIIREAKKKANETKGADQFSYWALMGKLGRLNRTGAFDTKGVKPIEPKGLLLEGKVSVFDLSYCSDILKNIVIANLLDKVFDHKKAHLDAPRTLVVIEEAHTFISRENRQKMEQTIEMLREIARRGRKRWLGLCFISQQPSHLPNEIFELCNTRIVHSIKSKPNLDSLKLTAGDVSEEMWNNVPTLGIGKAVISSPQYRDPIVVNIRPCETERKLID